MEAYAKNDRIDAQMIRHYSQSAFAKNRLKLRESRTQAAQKLEALLRRRNQLVGQRAMGSSIWKPRTRKTRCAQSHE
jgi:transposase